MEGLQPVVNLGGNDCGNGWGGAVGGAAAGGFLGSIFGSWFGNGWGNGYNRGGGGGDCCAGTAAAAAAATGNQYIMDSLTTMRSDVNSIGRDQLMQTANINAALCNGFGTAISATQNVGAQLAQGQCRTEAAVLATGLQGQIQQKDNTIFQLNAAHENRVQGMQNTYELKSSIDSCCCNTNANIERQGCATREVLLSEGCATRATIKDEGDKTRGLIAQLDRERLLREMCAKDAKIAQLESQTFNTGLAAATNAQVDQRIQNQTQTLLQHMAAFAAWARPTAGTPTPTGGGAAS